MTEACNDRRDGGVKEGEGRRGEGCIEVVSGGSDDSLSEIEQEPITTSQ